jgi:hypothetical protein
MEPMLPLDRGVVSVRGFEVVREAHVAQFTSERVGVAMRENIRDVLASPGLPRALMPKERIKARKLLATMDSIPLAPVLTHARPTLEAYATKHGYQMVVEKEDAATDLSPDWQKIALLSRLLNHTDEVLWIDPDAVILDNSEDLAGQVDPSAFQALVRHWTDVGDVPDTGVWFLRGAKARAFLRTLVEAAQRDGHCATVSATLMDLLGYRLDPPLKQMRTSIWSNGTQWLDAKWNAIPPWVPADHARIRHYKGASASGMTPDAIIARMERDADQAHHIEYPDYHWWPEERVREHLETIYQRIVARDGYHIQSGPFAGMIYLEHVGAEDIRRGSAFLPKLVGSYESELNEAVAAIVRTEYRRIINVGSAEGYYAIGLAMRMPAAQVIAFELDDKSRHWCEEMAEANHVADRVAVEGICTTATLRAVVEPGALLVVDCEGDEAILLDPDQISELKHCDVLVELHDMLVPGVSQLVMRRFAQTHDIAIISPQPYDPSRYAFLQAFTEEEQYMAVDELRGEGAQWAFMRAKAVEPLTPRIPAGRLVSR